MASINSVTIDLKVRGEATATKSLKDFAKANEKVGTNVVGLANKVSAGVKEFSKLDAMHKQGIITENARRKAQAELARQMSVLTGLTETQTRAALRAAETARKNAEETRRQAAADAAAAANKKRLEQSYDQLLASINPTIAAQQRMRQTQKMLRDAVAAGAITASQAAAALRQYQAAAQAAGAAGQMAARRTNQLGVLFQQTGYQVGDFAVQVQSGTDFMVALGQQATQLVGTFAMLSRSTRNIAIFSALGVAVPILTAVGAGFTRSGEAANIFADIVENRLGSLEPVFRGLGNLAKLLSDAFEPLGRVSVENLDRLLVAGTLVAGFFAGKFIASTNLATAAVARLRTGITALGISIQLAGVRATAAMVAMGALTAVLTRIVLPLAAVYAATEGVMFVIRQFRKEAEDASQTDLESTLERLAKGGIEVDKVMDALNDSVSAYRDATDDALQTNEELTESFGRQASAMERLFEQRRKLAEIEARGAAADALNIGLAIDDESVQRFIGNVDKISENYDKLKTAIESGADIPPTARMLYGLSQQVTKFAETLNLTKIGALEFAGAIKSAQEAAASGDTERMANAVQNLYDTLNAALLPGAELSDQMRSYLQSLVGGEIILREFLALQEESADATGRSADELIRQVTHQMQIATLQKEINDGVNEILASRNAELQKQQDRITLAQTELQFGKESQEYRNAQLTIEERILREQLAQNGILGNNAQKIVDAWREASNLEQAVADARDAAFDLADEIGEAATNALKLAGIDITSGVNSAAAAAKALAIRLGASVDAALALINIEGGMKQQSGPRRESGRTLPQVTANVPGSLGEAYRRSMELGEFAKDTGGGVSEIERLQKAYESLRASVDETFASQKKYKEAQDTLNKALKAGIISGKEYEKVLELIRKEYGVATKGAKSLGDIAGEAFEEAYVTTEEYNDLLKNEMVKGIENVSGAFTDFIMSGLRNFESFADAIKSVFRNLIATLVQTAIQNQIVIPIVASVTGGGIGGIGGIAGGGFLGGFLGGGGGFLGSLLGTGGGGLAGLAGSGGILGGLGSFASGLGGVLSGGGLGSSFSMLGGIFSGSVGVGGGSMAAALGAALPAIGIIGAGIAAVASLFKKKTTVVGQGLDIAIDETEALVQSFTTLRKKSLLGKSSYSVVMAEAPSDIAEPIAESINQIQNSIIDSAAMFGVASDAFDDFTYHLMLDLRGLTEDQQIQKVTEELSKMGDEFAALSGVFENMNELLAAANEKMQLQNRLDQLLGNNLDILNRQRDAELAAVNPLNRALLERIHLLESEAMMGGAIESFASGIMAQQNAIRSSVIALVTPLQEAIDRTRDQAQSSYRIFRTAADQARDEAKKVVDIITGAINARTIESEAVQRLQYQRAQEQLASFAGGGEFTTEQLRRATEAVSIDTVGFFGSFEDYARDFYKTQISLTKLADKAEGELTDVEKQIDVAEKAYQVALGTYQETQDFNSAIEQLNEDLESYTDTVARNEPFIAQIKAEGDRQVELLDSILAQTIIQFNALRGIETSTADLVGTNVTVSEALGVIGIEGEKLAGAVISLDPLIGDVGSHVADLKEDVVAFDSSTKQLLDSTDGLGLGVTGLDGSVVVLDESIRLQQETIRDVGINIFNLGETLSTAMGGLGDIVSGLSSSVSNLVSSNKALADAQKAANVIPDVDKVLKDSKDVIEESKNTSIEKLLTRSEVDAAIQKANELGANYITTVELEALKVQTEFSQVELQRALESAESFIKKADTAATDASKSQVSQELLDAITPKFAAGGTHIGGMRLVGEQGPELEVTGPSRIYSAQQTKDIMSGGSSETALEIRMLRREVSELRAEQRKIGVESVKYNKKTYDLNREWDIAGLPATRS